MASSVQQAPAGIVPPTADIVGNAFVHQYYLILHQSPELVHRFYQDISKLGRPEENGVMSTTSTMQAINEKILSLDYGKLSADITTVDAQDSYNGGVFVLVTGYLTGEDNLRRKFTQSFFLAPQDKGYFVLNDVFRYVDEPIHQNENQVVVNDVDGPLAPEHESSAVQENHVSEHATAVPDDIDKEEVYNTENVEVLVEEEEAPVPVAVDEIPDDVQVVDESNSKSEVPKKSYASIVKVMKENAVPFSAPSPSPVRSAVQKNPEQHVNVTATPAPTPALISETLTSSANVSENGNIQEAEGVVLCIVRCADGYSIYIKGLPVNATVAVLENEFKKFGPIKSGGVQVKSQKGFCFGFVEFEVASAVQSAIEASPISINGRPAVVEEKRSTNRGNNRGRFSSARSNGYRNEGTRGRGSYGSGRGYGRGGDFNSRAEFGNKNNNRGGMANRGGEGYQRAENGGRVNRAGGLGVNATAKSTAPRVSASA
nr:nuclear transport factor 2-like isoform X1 [Ziziphus jujuba var. spinosa]